MRTNFTGIFVNKTLEEIRKERNINLYLSDCWKDNVKNLEVVRIVSFKERNNLIQDNEMFVFEKDNCKMYKKYYKDIIKFKVIKKIDGIDNVNIIKVKKQIRSTLIETPIFEILSQM